MDEPIIILSPHSDDAALSVPSTIRLLQSRGHAIKVLTCFSRSNWAPTCGDRHEVETISKIREKEDRVFAELMGPRVQAISLGLDDFPMRRPLESSPIRVAEQPEVSVVQELVRVIRPHAFQAKLLLSPLGLGGHLDHCSVTAATLALAGCHPVAFYEEVPYRLPLDGEQIKRRVDWVASQLAESFHPRLIRRADQGDLWYRAASCFPSQFSDEELLRMKEKVLQTPAEQLWCLADGAVNLLIAADGLS